jgi:RimJ/RimL family protein N-acetyltransferase
VAAWDADDETQRWFDWPATRPAGHDWVASAHTTVEAKWASWACDGEVAFIIREPPGGEAVGWCDLRLGAEGCGEVSYGVLAGHRGRGVASRAVTLLVRYAFEELGAERLELKADELNAASLGVARRVGFTRVPGIDSEGFYERYEPMLGQPYRQIRFRLERADMPSPQ